MTTMRHAALLAVGAVVFALASTPGHAQVIKKLSEVRTVTAGRVAVLSSYDIADAACNAAALPEVTVQQPPVHGTISVTTEKVTQTRALLGGADCSAHPLDGQRVRFRPAPGYSGPDRVVLDVRFRNGVVEYAYDITIMPPRE